MQTFNLKLRDGSLYGAGCVTCVRAWLDDRKVYSEIVDDEIPVQFKTELSPNAFYEVSGDGTFSRMNVYVQRHPRCDCKTVNTVPNAPQLNFAFTSCHQNKTARYGTPNGNLWLTSATYRDGETVYAAAMDRETARREACARALPETDESRELKALSEYAENIKAHYLETNRSPKLIVGTNAYLRGLLPFFVLQSFDLHLVFYPNDQGAWVIGLDASARQANGRPPIHVVAAARDPKTAIERAIFALMATMRPADWGDGETETEPPVLSHADKRAAWHTHWIYRLSKISLKDVLALETYDRTPLETKPARATVNAPGGLRLLKGGKLL